jgi:hypothetical protein
LRTRLKWSRSGSDTLADNTGHGHKPYHSWCQNMSQICDFPRHLRLKCFSTKSSNISWWIWNMLFLEFHKLVYKHSAPPLASSGRWAHYRTDEHQTKVFSKEVPSTFFEPSQLKCQTVHYIDYLFCLTLNFHQLNNQKQGLCQPVHKTRILTYYLSILRSY